MTAERMTTGRLGTVVFAGLVVATVAAFFVTQRLKRADPVVKNIDTQLFVSPNGDGRKDRARIRFTLPKNDRVTVSIIDERGDEIRRLKDGNLEEGRHTFWWNGRNGSASI